MKFKTVNIKGKEYVPVHEKIKYFRSNEEYKGWQLITEIISLTNDMVTMKTSVINENGVVIANGHANESINNG